MKKFNLYYAVPALLAGLLSIPLFFTGNVLAEPNILLIISDDQRFDQTGYTPTINQQIASKGISYKRAYVTTPLCCPSRSAIYTGQYNGRNQVRGNAFKLLGNTIYKDFEDKYFLGLIGKYLNSHDGTPLPEFDFWVVQPYGKTGYFRQQLNVNGTLQSFKGIHYSRRIADFAETFLAEAARSEKPWFLTCSFFAPHAPAQPDPVDRGRFDGEPIVPRDNLFRLGKRKPKYIRARPVRNDSTFAALQKAQRDVLYSMDRGVKSILGSLEKYGFLENTIIIFLSDNGLMFGEHFLTSKGAPYEESVRVPLYIRYDAGIKKPQIYRHIVGNIDLAPTLYELSGITPGHHIDGVSLVPTFHSEEPVRDYLMLEGWKNRFKTRPNWYAIHSGQEVLILNEGDKSEYYDLRRDPFQLNNKYKPGRHSQRKADLEARLKSMVLDTRGTLDFNAPEGVPARHPDKLVDSSEFGD